MTENMRALFLWFMVEEKKLRGNSTFTLLTYGQKSFLRAVQVLRKLLEGGGGQAQSYMHANPLF